jgi:hypothetical protein
MKFLLKICAATAMAGALASLVPVAFAQNSPGVPGGILNDEFHFNEHPDMPFAASAPNNKYQHGPKSKARKAGDNGDPNGCNLQCPDDN